MLRALIVLIAFSSSAWAANFGYLPTQTPQQKELRALLDSGNLAQALTVWNLAHKDSSFGRTQNGKATYAYLLYKNSMPVTGLEILLTETTPKGLNSDLLKLWSVELGSSEWIQKGYLLTPKNWQSVQDNRPSSVSLRTKKDILKAFRVADQISKSQTHARVRIWWQIATQAPLINATTEALKAIKLIRESGQTLIGEDLIQATFARILYQRNELDQALEAYKQIPKSSNLWVESVEERAWTHLKKGDMDKATSETITLMSAPLAPLVGPEAYFLTNLIAYRVCDYPRVFKTSELFKARHRERLQNLQDLADTGANKNLAEVLGRFDSRGVSIESAGNLVNSIPFAAYRDRQFVRSIKIRQALLAEAGKLDASLAASARLKADRQRQAAVSRLRTLAQRELREYRQNLNKMHILEGEVIQRLAVDENLKGERSKLAKADDQGEVLVFPYDPSSSREVWIDELDNYKARVKDCPTLKGAGL